MLRSSLVGQSLATGFPRQLGELPVSHGLLSTFSTAMFPTGEMICSAEAHSETTHSAGNTNTTALGPKTGPTEDPFLTECLCEDLFSIGN